MPGAWESEAEWRRLKRELDAWRARRVRADALGQHRSQLDAAYTLVDRVLAELRVAMASMTGAGASLAEQARVHDRRLAWLRRLWDFFRERFDQRDDPALGAVLTGADEVVWSCHREPFAALVSIAGAESGPPPLPYVEPSLTPEVFPNGLVPGALRRDIDAPFLRRALDQLPFAVVRVPASCVTAPWWLIHLGHEVGHVVDARLLGYSERAALVQALGLDAPRRRRLDAMEWRDIRRHVRGPDARPVGLVGARHGRDTRCRCHGRASRQLSAPGRAAAGHGACMPGAGCVADRRPIRHCGMAGHGGSGSGVVGAGPRRATRRRGDAGPPGAANAHGQR